MEKINIVWDATLADTYQSCAAKYKYRFNMQKEAVDKPLALDTGSLVHIGQEAYYKFLKKSTNWEGAVLASHEAAKLASRDSDLPPEDLSRVLEVLEETQTVWRFKDISLEILAVEHPFSYVLHEDDRFRIIMIGKIDLLYNDYPNYMNVPMDHKTYRSNRPVSRFTNQFLNYSFAVQSQMKRLR
jgi:hypothetical protein